MESADGGDWSGNEELTEMMVISRTTAAECGGCKHT